MMRKTKVLIIIIALILVLIGVSIVALFFGTDTFKSSKEMFFKYATQLKSNNFIKSFFVSRK